MTYSEIKEAIKNRLEYVPASSQELHDDLVMGGYSTNADFEDIMCEYVDACNEIKRLKNTKKRQIISYKAMGYMDWEIADKLKISERMVRKHTASIKKFYGEVPKI